MQAAFELTEGRAKLETIIQSFPPESPYWNEAQNRFQFVDRLLTECLGWERPYIEVEKVDEAGGKSDYVLGQPPKAVLEAKKEARYFETLPTGKPSVVRKLKPLLATSKAFEEAVLQVIPYCILHGAQVAIVCNGPQLAIFQAMIVGQSPLDGECYLFNGFDSYLTNFPVLWSLLSPEGIAENRAYRDLALHRNPRIPPKASTFIPDPNKYRYRNHFQENLRSLSSLLLEEIEDNPNLKSSFYKECYVPIEANNRHLLLSKRIISARYQRSAGEGVRPANMELGKLLNDKGQFEADPEVLAGVTGSRPVVILGDVGVGKTSFFENLYEQLSQSDQDRTYFIHIDLGKKANLSVGLKAFVLSAVPQILKKEHALDIASRDFVNTIYHEEIRDFRKGVKGALKDIDPVAYQKELIAFLDEKVANRDTHLLASIGHLARGQNKNIVVIIDNADQRNFDVQQEAFLIAQELAATRNMVVFIALRPSTFYQSKMAGALSGYQNKVFTISPPPADEVLQRRITFALNVAEGKIAPAALTGIRLQLGNVVLFLRAALRSIRMNEEIRRFLSNITGGNTRSVIELFEAFCGSPNVDSRKIVQIEEEYHNYNVPLHEFTKHALLGEYAYFNAQSSLVACNIFDVSAADPREHFLSSLIIAYLSSNLGIKDNDGFVVGPNLLAEMMQRGYFEDQIRHSLRRLAFKRLIETPYAHFRELPVKPNQLPEDFHFRATSIGIYHFRYWTGSFAFLDATSTDTPIFEEGARGKIVDLTESFEVRDRYEKAITFRDYLERQWHLANIDANYFDFPFLVRSQEPTFESVRNFLNRPKAKKRGRSQEQ